VSAIGYRFLVSRILLTTYEYPTYEYPTYEYPTYEYPTYDFFPQPPVMCPLSVSTSRSTHALETGEAKLWSLLVGVNQYQDPRLPSLSYSASDCQGLVEALAEATQGFPSKEPIAHHDFASHPPTLAAVRKSLEQIVAVAQPQDTILLYFSGHGVLDRETGQVVLCLSDTSKDNLLQTGLKLPDVLELLHQSKVNRQMLWLDACHSGDLTLRGAKGEVTLEQPELNPAQQLIEVLRQRATQSRGFYALLSCDRKQRSWEFPELKHGLFTYYLMQGLRGEAADAQGVIEADGLYKYVYYQTIQYIDRLNHQLRLRNQQKRSRGELDLHPEYPLQTPKRIVEGVGELVLGLKVESDRTPTPVKHSRRALVCDGFADSNAVYAFSRTLQTTGNFALEYFPQPGKAWADVRYAIQNCLRSPVSSQDKETVLLYLRGRMEAIADGEAWLVMGDNLRLSRSWLRQELRRSATTQQIVILDFLGIEASPATLQEWIEELQLDGKQCIIAAASSTHAPEQFIHSLLETLATKELPSALSVTAWMYELRQKLEQAGMPLHLWLSETASEIEILPPTALTATKFVSPSPPKIDKPAVSEWVAPKVQPPAPAIPSPAPAPVPPLPAKEYFPQQYAQLEKILRELVGPIAPTLLSQVVTPNSQPQNWVENLLPILSPQQQNQLRQQAIALLQSPASQPQTRSSCATSWQHETLSESFIHQCEQALSAAIGPIATFLLQNTIKSQPQISRVELVETLSAAIHDPLQASAFRRRLL